MRFSTLLVDPPWNYGDTGRKSLCRPGQRGAPQNHYPTMVDDDIVALPIGALAADDALLILWATWPKAETAFRAIEAWNFRYITGFPWVKVTNLETFTLKYGTGYYARGATEMVLLGRRGKAPPRNDYAGIISESFQHSRKPLGIHQYAEGFPGPHVEVFARRPVPGWVTLGDDIDGQDIRAAIAACRDDPGLGPGVDADAGPVPA